MFQCHGAKCCRLTAISSISLGVCTWQGFVQWILPHHRRCSYNVLHSLGCASSNILTCGLHAALCRRIVGFLGWLVSFICHSGSRLPCLFLVCQCILQFLFWPFLSLHLLYFFLGLVWFLSIPHVIACVIGVNFLEVKFGWYVQGYFVLCFFVCPLFC